MSQFRLLAVLIALALSSGVGPAYADEDYTMLRLRYEFDAGPRVRVDFGFVSRAADEDLPRAWLVPLFDTRRGGPGPGLRHAEGSQPFCETTLIGCLAIGAVMAAGIFVFVDEFSRQSRNDNDKLTVNVNTGTATSP